jgi:hypothetical protein
MYVKIKNNVVEKYPYSIDLLKRDHPQTSFPQNLTQDILAGYGVFKVVEEDRPETDNLSYAVKRHLPELVAGEYRIGWDIVQKTPEQLAQEHEAKKQTMRSVRNEKLAFSDWTQLADSPVDKAAWATYRQALRDLPHQPGFPDINLPSSPDSVEIGE